MSKVGIMTDRKNPDREIPGAFRSCGGRNTGQPGCTGSSKPHAGRTPKALAGFGVLRDVLSAAHRSI